MDEAQELVRVQVAAVHAERGEAVQFRDAIARGRRRRRACSSAARPRDHGAWRFAGAERDAREDRIGCTSGGLGASADFERPLSVEGGRRIAKVRVAGLIAQMEWHGGRAGLHALGDRELHADSERLLEDRERLVLTGLLQIG